MMRSRADRTILLLVLLVLSNAPLAALPRYSLLSGTRCSACHFNPQGSGIRNELGWSAMNLVGAVAPDSIGLGGLWNGETNTLFDGLVTLGLDLRVQMAKVGRPPTTERLVIPMQTMPYVAVAPAEWISIYGGYNFSLDFSDRFYPGQVPYEAAVQVQPEMTLPILRAGFIQPSVGVRHDDHTVFTRREVARFNTALLPPNYVELGGEVTYEGLHWLTLNAGVYKANHLSRVERTVDSTKPTISGRVMLWPQLLDEGINGELGASALVNGEFRMFHFFGGFGLADKATFYAEGMYSRNSDERQIRNLMVQGSWLLAQWLSVHMRYEWAQTEHPTAGIFHANAFTAGAEFFPLPYIEIRPEYRYLENANYRIGQYAVQLHLFY